MYKREEEIVFSSSSSLQPYEESKKKKEEKVREKKKKSHWIFEVREKKNVDFFSSLYCQDFIKRSIPLRVWSDQPEIWRRDFQLIDL